MVTLNKPSAGNTAWYQPVTDNWTTIENGFDQAICQGRLTLASGNPAYAPQARTPSSTDTANDTVDFPIAHGWTTGTMVIPLSTVGGLTGGTVYYVRVVDSDTISFHSTLANALSNTKIDLTASITVEIQPFGVASTTLYFTPYLGNRISLYDGSSWTIATLSERSLSISALIANVTYDVFIYDNAGTLTLETSPWKSVTATSSPTAGLNKTINLPDTAGVVVGSYVTVKDGSNSEVARVTAVVANFSITVENIAAVAGYTLPDVYYPVRSSALSLQDGIYVKSGATTRRFLGSLRMALTSGIAGQGEDSLTKRFLVNYYNRMRRTLFTCPGYSNNDAETTYGLTGSFAPMNAGTGSRVEMLSNGEDICSILAQVGCYFDNAWNEWMEAGPGIDSITNAVRSLKFYGIWNSSVRAMQTMGVCHYDPVLAEGYHTIDLLGVGAAYVVADTGRAGAVADPPCTYLEAIVMA